MTAFNGTFFATSTPLGLFPKLVSVTGGCICFSKVFLTWLSLVPQYDSSLCRRTRILCPWKQASVDSDVLNHSENTVRTSDFEQYAIDSMLFAPPCRLLLNFRSMSESSQKTCFLDRQKIASVHALLVSAPDFALHNAFILFHRIFTLCDAAPARSRGTIC